MNVWIEVGPGSVLSSLVKSILPPKFVKLKGKKGEKLYFIFFEYFLIIFLFQGEPRF